ncbi:CLIP domain-containing serine protease [Halocaridina rubra]|uniref:CLIP domain-containing serine protease n=1 Tax=Halocaridina rubra TaxID=373956 RepID=A0AAN9A9Z3_HALRR
MVRLGEWDISGETEFYKHVEYRVSGLYIHHDYSRKNLNNDIAVIRLENLVDFASNPHITPVCLPSKQSDFTNYRCFATGWGRNTFVGSGKISHVLKAIEVPVLEKQRCQQILQNTRFGVNFVLPEGNICAGEENRDTCTGDGGGPLVCQGLDGNMQLAGLLSWGIGCGQQGIPGVYVKVSHYLDWINNITRE